MRLTAVTARSLLGQRDLERLPESLPELMELGGWKSYEMVLGLS
jgi:hypothetical protein